MDGSSSVATLPTSLRAGQLEIATSCWVSRRLGAGDHPEIAVRGADRAAGTRPRPYGWGSPLTSVEAGEHC